MHDHCQMLTEALFPCHHCLLRAEVCGDAFQDLRDPSLGNYFATKVTQATSFTAGQRVRFSWQLTANHGGFLAFKICSRNTNLDQACFDAKPLQRCAGSSSCDPRLLGHIQ